MKRAFAGEPLVQAAVLYHLTVIGEAVRRVSRPTRLALPDVPWIRISNLRNVLIHDYDDVRFRGNLDARDAGHIPRSSPSLEPIVTRTRRQPLRRRLRSSHGQEEDAPGPRPSRRSATRTTRVNIPTEELRDFVVKDEEKPRTVLYPRDPTLDPQLVWKGKDEQDAEPLAVPVVPIYIQEKIQPQALIENLRKTAKARRTRARAAALRGLQRPARRVRPARGLLRPRVSVAAALVEPDDPRRLAHRDDEPRREGRPQGPGADDLLRPALRHQVRLELAGLDAQARREGRQGRRTPRASRSRSAPSATPGSSASTRTLPTCATASPPPATCSPTPAASSSRSATRTSTSSAA